MNQADGITALHGGSATLAWEPESPFLNPPLVGRAGVAVVPAGAPSWRALVESPFTAEYAGEDAGPGPHAEAFAALVDELHDEGFAEALEDLVNEASAVLEEGFSSELGDPGRERVAMERTLRSYLQPLEREAEAMLDRMAEELGEKDLSVLNEAEVEALLESYTAPSENLSPAFEGFLGGILKKAKKAVKKVASVVGARVILNRLKGLVRPLLNRVLKHAINKLPVTLRPTASQLAQKILGGGKAAKSTSIKATAVAKSILTAAPTDATDSDDAGQTEPSATDPAEIQEELDVQLAGYMLAGEAFEPEIEAEQLVSSHAEAERESTLQELDRARQHFAEAIVRQDEGEDPTPLVQQFVPAILPALKIGIKVVGRPRVVKFLAGLVANFIQKYVGRPQAMALSTALVDTGLRLVSLETTEGEAEAAGQALAATVEDTVTRVVQRAPAEAWESEALLEAYVQEAFLESASAHFPDPLIREELHESSNASGAWVPLPAGRRRKRYKKYTRVIDVSITPQVANAVKTFGGTSLDAFLRDRMGVSIPRALRARVHLYEAIPGTRLSLIALHENGVSGLGNARRGAWSLFHPLTPEAAGLLLNEPRLGTPTPASFLVRRRVTAVGQRFYYLEIPGARVRIAPGRIGRQARPARSSQTRVVLDFVKRQVRVGLYYSEADAQEIAKHLRQRAPLAVLLRALKGGRDRELVRILSGQPTAAVRIVHEASPTEELAAPMLGGILRMAGGRLSQLVSAWTLDGLRKELDSQYDRFTGTFERAVQADDDGITVVLTIDAPQLFGALRSVFSSILGTPALPKQPGSVRVEIRPGFAVR
jgi:hypothetical protein